MKNKAILGENQEENELLFRRGWDEAPFPDFGNASPQTYFPKNLSNDTSKNLTRRDSI
ncbi:MAG: hypothetical protein LBI42_02980 [Chitinispirillales bacterium]|nr:hypothetical protein [Chitinispirillales bacterium]